MRARSLGECAQLKPSLLKGEHESLGRRTSQRLLPGLADASSTEDRLMWHGDRLLLRAGRRLLSAIEPDPEWPGMWRVRLPDNHLSDMANRTRAKDAAQLLALATLTFAEGK
jgi:hypothetical protein